jgi:Tic22-like family
MDKSLTSLIALIAMSLPIANIGISPAQALPEAQILEKLQKVPVFTITNKTGNFLQQSIGAAPKVTLFTPVYLELKDAQFFLQKLKNEGTENGKLAQVTPVPLSEVYKLQMEAKKKADNMNFVFFPTQRQLKNAQLLKKPYQFNALYPVPLFMIAIKQNNQYATIQENNLTPLFFDKQQAQQWLDKVKKKDPKLVAKAEIKVNYLHTVMKDFQERNYPAQQQFVLIPSAESIEGVRKLQTQQPKPSPTPTPATVTPKK